MNSSRTFVLLGSQKSDTLQGYADYLESRDRPYIMARHAPDMLYDNDDRTKGLGYV